MIFLLVPTTKYTTSMQLRLLRLTLKGTFKRPKKPVEAFRICVRAKEQFWNRKPGVADQACVVAKLRGET